MLPLPALLHMAHSAFGHGRFTTAQLIEAPETEVRYCNILAHVVSYADVTGKGLTVSDGST